MDGPDFRPYQYIEFVVFGINEEIFSCKRLLL